MSQSKNIQHMPSHILKLKKKPKSCAHQKCESSSRDLGFKRWPQRKLNSLNLLISTLQADNEGPTVDDYTEVIITRLKEERRRVQKNPDYKFAPSTKKLRRQNFKAIYKRKKELNLALATTFEARPLESITKEEIVQYFHLPISEAASKLNVGLSVFKKCCRDMGFKRWPNRTLNSLDSLINTLQAENGGATVDAHTKQIITSLKEEKMRVQEDPDYKLTPTTKKIRQRNFKARYKWRKHLNLDATTEIDATPLDVIYPTDNTDSEEIDGDYGSDNDSLE
ncbi:protein RKD2 [Artemisia annua]|uniref:Protein RKD2 n=1 Tax=Artemisia annua TaxID=35608 RepID=A0A2U1LXW7_ARTAN|nr:protein RKD2 [Artemisia annua]